MRVLQRVVQDLRAGWITLRQGTAEAATRALEESEVARLRLRLRKLDEQLDHVHEDIGERALAHVETGEVLAQAFQHADMVELLTRVHSLQEERRQIVAAIEDVRNGL